ncbi:chemotaxis protein [Pseudomonas syringae]|uniref:chemotaxis protein n=1 Tax=Pseudomonas syringae TaxID=317 RepID=UPI003F74E188
MKLVFRQYVAALRERDELDVVLPDLLSELGYNVISRPGRGTDQAGVDVLAVGPADAFGDKKLYAFTIKKGDLTRDDWSGTNQSLVNSIDDIVFNYFPSRVPPELKILKKVICICFGGGIQEPMRLRMTGLMKTHLERYDVEFEEWNGDKLAGLLSNGVLREQLVSKGLRSHFQKSIAMLDEPEVSYANFSLLLNGLLPKESPNPKSSLTALRQTYVCLSVLYVWAREAENLEAPFRASELVILHAWDFIKTKTTGPESKNLRDTFVELLYLHFRIWDDYYGKKILPIVGMRHAVSAAVNPHSPVDTNLKLFDILGRLAQRGLWMLWEAGRANADARLRSEHQDSARHLAKQMYDLIINNDCLFSPCTDIQSTDIATALFFLSHIEEFRELVQSYCAIILEHYRFAYGCHDRYPTHVSRYRDLISHPLEKTEEYQRWHTSGSTLIPLVLLWATIDGASEHTQAFAEFANESLRHCCHQLWMVKDDSEGHIYKNDQRHGAVLTEIPITADGVSAMSMLEVACKSDEAYQGLSAIRQGYGPLLIMACRHYRLPLPPHIWIAALRKMRSTGRGHPG